MKTILLIILVSICSCLNIVGADIDRVLVREPGEYSLDASGSTLAISEKHGGEWPLRIDWRSRDDRGAKITVSVVPNRTLVGEGWFIFVEAPKRIWAFDGERSGMLFISSDNETSSAAWSGRVMVDCPEEVWSALPENVKDYWKRAAKVSGSLR